MIIHMLINGTEIPISYAGSSLYAKDSKNTSFGDCFIKEKKSILSSWTFMEIHFSSLNSKTKQGTFFNF
jgi:hypothetical protein